MSLTSLAIQVCFGIADFFRDLGLETLSDIRRVDGIDYQGDGSTDHLLDLYMPKDIKSSLPVIVSIHGGGWVYGTKKNYQFFCERLAQLGYAVVNFNYRLAPKYTFPAQLHDVNTVCAWLVATGKKYSLDLNRVYLVGDSAGAQLACQYAAMLASQEYADLFGIELPNIHIRAIGCACPMFDPLGKASDPRSPELYRWMLNALLGDYLGKDRVKNIEIITDQFAFWKVGQVGFPPLHLAYHANDLLVDSQLPWIPDQTGPSCERKIYGNASFFEGHVFHLNIRSSLGRQYLQDLQHFFGNH